MGACAALETTEPLSCLSLLFDDIRAEDDSHLTGSFLTLFKMFLPNDFLLTQEEGLYRPLQFRC